MATFRFGRSPFPSGRARLTDDRCWFAFVIWTPASWVTDIGEMWFHLVEGSYVLSSFISEKSIACFRQPSVNLQPSSRSLHLSTNSSVACDTQPTPLFRWWSSFPFSWQFLLQNRIMAGICFNCWNQRNVPLNSGKARNVCGKECSGMRLKESTMHNNRINHDRSVWNWSWGSDR